MSAPKDWFTVDRAGLAKILRRKGIEFAVFELIQNGWDEAGVTKVNVTLEPAEERGYAKLTITDDAPEGFSNLAFAYTLFAESEKKGNAEQRGRFNLGEKLVLALCKWATITTTKGKVTFDGEGRSVTTLTRREHGTVFEALIKMSGEERCQVGNEMFKLIPPFHITTTFNAEVLVQPAQAAEFTASLPTELADAEGNLRGATRQALVRLYKLADGEQARIYEMGIPVVEHDCAFHCDVQQKVPLTLDRENVTPKFLRALRTEVYNHAHAAVTPEQTTAEWAQTAIESKDAEPEAVQDYMAKRFGDKRVSYDVSDKEANNRAVAEGYTLVHGGMLSGAAWKNVREFSAITPAGQMFPTHPDDFVPHEEAELTPGMITVGGYAMNFARLTIGTIIRVEFGKQHSREAAHYRTGAPDTLQFNVANLGEAWFDLEKNRLAIDDLIIHELGHHFSSNHLSEEYYDALTRIAAKAVRAAREGKI